jgi:hypothetical protein
MASCLLIALVILRISKISEHIRYKNGVVNIYFIKDVEHEASGISKK